MQVDVYRAKMSPGPRQTTYVFVRNGDDINSLPERLMTEWGGLEFEKSLVIHPREKRIALNTDEAIKNIKEKRYHVQATKIGVRERIG